MSNALTNPSDSGRSFWQDALAWHGAITPKVLPRVLQFGIFALLVALVHQHSDWEGLSPVHIGYAGGFLALLLALRSTAGYDRWWEARKLWGGIVNQSRNLTIGALQYGPSDPVWRAQIVRWTVAFGHTTRSALSGERDMEALARVLGDAAAAAELDSAQHPPSRVAARLASLLREAQARGGLDGFALLLLDRERMGLVDHMGGCERILRTPFPRVHSIKLRRFILLYLLWLPAALATEALWWTPTITMLIAYPLLAIDQIGQELDNPFSPDRASHLPLRQICRTIEDNLMALLADDERRQNVGMTT